MGWGGVGRGEACSWKGVKVWTHGIKQGVKIVKVWMHGIKQRPKGVKEQGKVGVCGMMTNLWKALREEEATASELCDS